MFGREVSVGPLSPQLVVIALPDWESRNRHKFSNNKKLEINDLIQIHIELTS